MAFEIIFACIRVHERNIFRIIIGSPILDDDAFRDKDAVHQMKTSHDSVSPVARQMNIRFQERCTANYSIRCHEFLARIKMQK